MRGKGQGAKSKSSDIIGPRSITWEHAMSFIKKKNFLMIPKHLNGKQNLILKIINQKISLRRLWMQKQERWL